MCPWSHCQAGTSTPRRGLSGGIFGCVFSNHATRRRRDDQSLDIAPMCHIAPVALSFSFTRTFGGRLPQVNMPDQSSNAPVTGEVVCYECQVCLQEGRQGLLPCPCPNEGEQGPKVSGLMLSGSDSNEVDKEIRTSNFRRLALGNNPSVQKRRLRFITVDRCSRVASRAHVSKSGSASLRTSSNLSAYLLFSNPKVLGSFPLSRPSFTCRRNLGISGPLL